MKAMVNLLPRSYRKQLITRKRMIQWGSVACLVIMAGSTWHWQETIVRKSLSQQLEVLAREQAPTQRMLKHLVSMRQQLKELEQQEAVASELEHQRNALTLLGVVSDAAHKTKGRLRVTKLELKDFQKRHGPGAVESAAASSPGLVLSGVSLDNPAVAELLESLQDSGIFSHVELLSCKERRDDAAALRDYELRCEF